MAETALATPFDSDEIVEIACEEFKKRLRGLSPLYSGKLYNSFALDFNVGIRLIRASGEPVSILGGCFWRRAAHPRHLRERLHGHWHAERRHAGRLRDHHRKLHAHPHLKRIAGRDQRISLLRR